MVKNNMERADLLKSWSVFFMYEFTLLNGVI